MNERPVIGLTARTLPLQVARKTRPNETVARSYFEPLEEAGALVVVLPNTDPERAEQYLEMVDGLYLTGGDDPHPHLFGEEPHPRIELVDERRDRFEIALTKGALARDLPVFGVCRGLQLLNVALGGDLFQDIESQADSTVGHAQRRTDDGPWHRIEVRAGTLLSRILGSDSLAVNSFHHQACRKVGAGLEIAATSAEDGLIEALEAPGRAFCLGVQWHPELSPAEGGLLFAAFFQAARERARAASKLKA